MRVLPNDKHLIYSGRIDWSCETAPVWIYPGTFVKLRFQGDLLRVKVSNRNAYWENYLGIIADGVQTKQQLPLQGEAVIEVALTETEDHIHDVMVFKRQDACHELTILEFELAEDSVLLMPEALPTRKIEVYGDSVSAGEVSEALEYIGKADPKEQKGEYSNSWYSYAWIAARELDAQLHAVAQGGIALLDNTGWYHAPDYIGMESAWDKVRYTPDFGPITNWDFSAYTPQIVLVAIGQNDSNPEDYMKQDYACSKAVQWREHYKAFLQKLRGVYPEANIICCTTLLEHDAAWDKSIGQAVQELGDEKISQVVFRRNGCGTPGHLRIPEAEEMAQELCAYIRSLNISNF